jgi:CxxC-x17-CxxC domain-containing protein
MGFKEGKYSRKPAGPSRASRFKSGPSFGKRDSARSTEKPSFSRGKGNFELFDVTCDKCGKDCQVPFRPTGGKPIYCRDCFGKGGDSPRKSSRDESSDLDEINEKLDKIMRALKIN